jgi:hypothetical protein
MALKEEHLRHGALGQPVDHRLPASVILGARSRQARA